MQSYAPISTTDTVSNGPSVINQNEQSIMSCNSGTAFPTTNLQVGMLCYRTDQSKLYQLFDTKPTWLMLLDCSTANQAAAQNAYGLLAGGTAWTIAGTTPTFGSSIPRIGSDGGMEVGIYVDFHTVSGDSADYAVRLTGANGALTCSGNFNLAKLLTVNATAPAWSPNNTAINFGPTGNLTLSSTSGQLILSNNSYAGASTWTAQIAQAAGLFGINSDGSFGWWHAPSVAAGAAQTLTSVMSLDASGNLTITGNGSVNGTLGVGGSLNCNGAANVGSVNSTGGIGIQNGNSLSMTQGASANPGVWWGTGGVGIYNPGGTNQLDLRTGTSSGSLYYFVFGADGTLSCPGNVSMPSFSVTSDRRLKTDIEPLTGFGELIDGLNLCTYTKGGERQSGVIAQELQEIAPGLVREGRGGMLEVDYLGLFIANLAETRSLRARVAELEAAR